MPVSRPSLSLLTPSPPRARGGSPPPLLRRGHQRTVARRVARLLLPVAQAAGGFTSTELRVRVKGRGSAWLPDVALVLGDLPVDGQVRRPPALVAVVDSASGDRAGQVGAWLDVGVPVVWHLHDEHVDVWTRAGDRRHGRGDLIGVTGLGSSALPQVRVDDLLADR